jgi:hypothetical protein
VPFNTRAKVRVHWTGPMGESLLAFQVPNKGSRKPSLPRPFVHADFEVAIVLFKFQESQNSKRIERIKDNCSRS